MDDSDLFGDKTPQKVCDGCSNRFEESELRSCRVCGKYYCSECRKTHTHRDDSENLKQINIDDINPVKPIPNDDEQICDGCGRFFSKSELRKCKKCGAVLCPDCRQGHKCNTKTKDTIINIGPMRKTHDDLDYECDYEYGLNKPIIILIVVAVLIISVLAVLFVTGSFQDPIVGTWVCETMYLGVLEFNNDGTFNIITDERIYGRGSWINIGSGEYSLFNNNGGDQKIILSPNGKIFTFPNDIYGTTFVKEG